MIHPWVLFLLVLGFSASFFMFGVWLGMYLSTRQRREELPPMCIVTKKDAE